MKIFHVCIKKTGFCKKNDMFLMKFVLFLCLCLSSAQKNSAFVLSLFARFFTDFAGGYLKKGASKATQPAQYKKNLFVIKGFVCYGWVSC